MARRKTTGGNSEREGEDKGKRMGEKRRRRSQRGHGYSDEGMSWSPEKRDDGEEEVEGVDVLPASKVSCESINETGCVWFVNGLFPLLGICFRVS